MALKGGSGVKKTGGRIPARIRDPLVTAALLALATVASLLLLRHTGAENNTALVYVLAVVLIALFTTGYFCAVIASLVGGFCTNYFFMYPYAQFSLEIAGYPVAMLSMVGISLVVCTLTSRVKLQAEEAACREQNTKALYALNQRLSEEKAAVELEREREAIRANILRAVSHDLRTPLTSISGAAAVLLDEGEGRSERDVAMLTDIRDDAEGMTTMVENLLSITRIQGGDAQLKLQSELLEDVAGDAVRNLRRRFPDVKVALALPDDILCLPMDPLLIRQVIYDLLENAVRHSGDREHIGLLLSREGAWAQVQVRDRGKGLPDEVLRAVAAGRALPGSTSGDASRGMGIGLTVCQSVLKAHGGTLSARNDPAGGAVFTLRLPMPIEEES